MTDRFGKPPLLLRLGILAGVLVFLLGAPAAALLWMTAVPGHSYAGPLPALTPAQAALAGRLRQHVEAIAASPHNVAHPAALAGVENYLAEALGGMGYQVQRQGFAAGGVAVHNFEAVIAPAAADAATLVVGAHYDSFGDAPGANDNATGAAAVLELARSLRDLEGHGRLRLRLVLFVNEEPPFFKSEAMGSLVYARALHARRERVSGMLALETLGFYSDAPGSQHYPAPLGMLYPSTGNFVAFVATVSSRSFVRETTAAFREAAAFPSVGGSAPAFIQGIDWSDHWSFGETGVPALMVTDTAPFRYPYYHGAADTAEKVDYGRLSRVVEGLDRVVRNWAERGGP